MVVLAHQLAKLCTAAVTAGGSSGNLADRGKRSQRDRPSPLGFNAGWTRPAWFLP